MVAPGQLDAARDVSKAFGEVTAQAMLFAAAQGVRQALGMEGFIGVTAARQVSLNAKGVAACARTYDAFYEAIGARLFSDGLYRGRVIYDEKPLSEVKAGHKIRTRRKRTLKGAGRDEVRRVVEEARIRADIFPCDLR